MPLQKASRHNRNLHSWSNATETISSDDDDDSEETTDKPSLQSSVKYVIDENVTSFVLYFGKPDIVHELCHCKLD